MLKKKNLAILIPVVLDAGVLFILPTVVSDYGLVRALGPLVPLAEGAAPWVPFFIISWAVSNEIAKEKQGWEAKRNQDFV